MQREDLTDYLKTLLDPNTIQDYSPNGLQVEGAADVYRLCTAVTASLAVITKAIDWNADALFVHHGLFWRGDSMPIIGMKKKRMAALLKHDINLYAYHLPLDIHPEFGNNVALGNALNCRDIHAHRVNQVEGLLWTGQYTQAKTAEALQQQLAIVLGRMPMHLEGGPGLIRTIAWCTGAAQDFIEEAAYRGADAYISGEVSERTYYQAKELGIHYFVAGHYATEQFGVQNIGQHLTELFNVETIFLEDDNPI